MKVLKNTLKAIWHVVMDFVKFFVGILMFCVVTLAAFFGLTCLVGWLWSFVPTGVSAAIGNAIPYILGAVLIGAPAICIGMIIKDEYDRIVDADECKVVWADGQPVAVAGEEDEK